MNVLRIVAGFAVVVVAGPAWAGETPLYQPAPAWVVAAPPIDAAMLEASAPALVIYDTQQRFENGRVWNYVDTATHATSAQMLDGMGTVTLPWMPEKGDLIIHRAEIIRGSEHIDLLKSGERFSVLRREQGLERGELNGALTATMAVQGLQVGDVLRVTMSITQADPALAGRFQAMAPLIADPMRAGFSRARFSWPKASDVHWKMQADGPAPVPRLVDGYREITVTMPLAKQPEIPDDAPGRYRHPQLFEATSFADWADVSRTMAPLFASDGLIAAGSTLAAEVATIVAADRDPVARAERALELVQGKIRYLAMGMNGGNYVPQPPAKTWELRYGDCKAKTLLLIAMLRAMEIEAEPVLASSGYGDLVRERLPAPGAFDHVLVHATIAGKSLWLDGTQAGARIEDVHDTPGFRYVLPLRPAGAALLPLPMLPDARPDVSVAVDYDQSAGVDLPSLFKATITTRGALAAMVNVASTQATAKQKSEMINGVVQQYVSDPKLSEWAMRYDSASGTAVITASGLISTLFKREERVARAPLDRALSLISFDPDRARLAWRAIPVATEGPSSMAYHTHVRLPDGGRGFTLEGDRTLSGTIAGVTVARTTTFSGADVTVDERIDGTGVEIAPADIAGERARLATARTRLLRAVASASVPRRWQSIQAGGAAARFKPLEAEFTKAIQADPEEVSGYDSRASFRAGIYDRRGAIEDLTQAIRIEATIGYYLRRASLHYDLGELDAALADAESARTLDPSSQEALGRLAEYRSDKGEAKAALALLQERIDLGGRDRFAYIAAKAEIQSRGGDTAGGIALLDAAIAEKPGDPMLLNARCWLKGTGNVALDSALKDCTRAIELSDTSAAALDSRAMVYFRMNRPEEALADLDAVIETAPGQSPSLFLRGVIRQRTGKLDEAKADLATARLLSPQVERRYRSYGIRVE